MRRCRSRRRRHVVEPLEPRVLLAVVSTAVEPPVPEGPGAYARFYNNTTLSGAPAATRVDPAIDFDFGTGSPAPGVQADHFSVRWSGTLHVPVSGYYTFVASTAGASSLTVTGLRVLTDPAPHVRYD